MSFFKKGQPRSAPKRKFQQNGKREKSSNQNSSFFLSNKKNNKINHDDEIDSDEFDDDNITNKKYEEDISDTEQETPQDKRLRLAKKYLQEIENEEKSRAEDVEDDNVLGQTISKRLDKEYLDSIGKLRRKIADQYRGFIENQIRTFKHKLQKSPTTCVCLSSDDKYLFTGSKTSVIVKWEFDGETQKSVGSFDLSKVSKNGRTHPNSITVTTDFKFIAVSDSTKNIYIYCPETLRHIHTLDGHRDSVTGLVFRKDTHMLYSSSKDRSVKIWSLDEMAYVETLFGHQFPITSIDALSRERVITSGGSDRSVRIWKISEESQLLFRGHNGNIEHVKLINEENFLSAADDGSLCSWSAMRKKPLCTLELVHGKADNEEPNWITSIATLINTDLAASGSYDGFIRLWKLGDNCRIISQILQIPVSGFINSLCFTSDGSKLIAGIGQEHRLGRWWKLKEAKNCIMIIPLSKD